MNPYRLRSIRIQGYRPFRDFLAETGPLEVLVGTNGSGKSSLFEFLKFLRDSMSQDIPPEIIAGSIGQRIFHSPGPERFMWDVEVEVGLRVPIHYQGELMGPTGRATVVRELVQTVAPLEGKKPFVLMDRQGGKAIAQDPAFENAFKEWPISGRPNQLALNLVTDPSISTLHGLREYISRWRFYSSFKIATEKIRRSVLVEQEPLLHEDAGNLSSLLHYLMTEHPVAFDELQQQLRSVIPGFKGLTVKARGGPGEVMAFWREEGVDSELSLADLSDGILRLICWTVLCLQPNPPSLICIDEPDQGVHPRTLPILAGLFEQASARTQIFLATHASYFLMQFDLSRIAVMRKEDGEAKYLRPGDSAVLMQNLKDFGPAELEIMHRSDELERLA